MFLGLLGLGKWSVILFMLFIVLCFYFTLTFFEYSREDDHRIIKHSKIGTTICLAIALQSNSTNSTDSLLAVSFFINQGNSLVPLLEFGARRLDEQHTPPPKSLVHQLVLHLKAPLIHQITKNCFIKQSLYINCTNCYYICQ